ncbi:AMP-binding protein [Desulfotruncus alcoholivorax]|uniref:AMP-binding protein n=1 Tax=Desulfotruncus alcoholivorax TaxID=265477 RepID=UPI000413C0C7|nr:AMP-binding protein [Desulfotruncus alcoholivorax]
MDPLHENLLHRATLGDLITCSALRFGDRIALVSGKERVSYKTLNERSCQAAKTFMEMGIGRGDRVAFMTHNCLDYIYCRFGLAKIGAAPVPLNFMLKGEEIVYIINDSEPTAFFVEDALVETVLAVRDKISSVKYFGWFGLSRTDAKPQDWIDAKTFFNGRYSTEDPEVYIESDDMATLMYTTGTEGFPKGVITTHLNYYMGVLHLVCDCDFNRNDVVIIDLPLFHVAGTTMLLGSIATGAKALIEYTPDPRNILRKTQDEGVTMWTYPPTLYHALPMLPDFDQYNISSLKKCITFGAVMPKVIYEKWKTIKPDLEWRNYWGQTESSPVGTTSIPEEFDARANSIGIPDTGVTVKVFDEEDREVPLGQLGELVIRGPAVMKGYWRNMELTEKTLRNGWLHTGDLGYQDESGYIYFVDRKKDMIKTGGENVSSQEVEGVLLRNPKVAMAAVIGMPHPYWSEAVTAHIVLKPGQESTAEEIIEFCKEHLAGYKVPKQVTFWSQLPMSPSGKIIKRKIKEEMLKSQGEK